MIFFLLSGYVSAVARLSRAASGLSSLASDAVFHLVVWPFIVAAGMTGLTTESKSTFR
jgi:hypothetical protein